MQTFVLILDPELLSYGFLKSQNPFLKVVSYMGI